MKKLSWVLALVMVLFVAPAMAQSWYPTNTIVLGWDAVPLYLPTDAPNQYQVYSRQDLVSNGTPVGTPVTALKLAVTFSQEGRYYLGVKTVRFPQGETVGQLSAGTAWSNVAADTGGNPFGVTFFASAATPVNLRKVVP